MCAAPGGQGCDVRGGRAVTPRGGAGVGAPTGTGMCVVQPLMVVGSTTGTTTMGGSDARDVGGGCGAGHLRPTIRRSGCPPHDHPSWRTRRVHVTVSAPPPHRTRRGPSTAPPPPPQLARSGGVPPQPPWTAAAVGPHASTPLQVARPRAHPATPRTGRLCEGYTSWPPLSAVSRRRHAIHTDDPEIIPSARTDA